MREFITRKINREYNDILLSGAKVGQNGNFEIDATNAERANDYLVMAMCEKSQDDIDNMDQKEFETLLNKINALKTTPRPSSDK